MTIKQGADRIELSNDLTVGGTTPHIGDLEVVMHMAFDELTNAEQRGAIDWLSQNRVKRILIHGRPLNQPISHTLDHLKEVVKQSKNKIEILPGGGITKANINKIVEQIKIKQVHGTKLLG